MWCVWCAVNIKATKATQTVSEHHLTCITVSKGWISPAPSPARGACVGLLAPIISLSIAQPFLRKLLVFPGSPEHSSESRRCGDGLISGFGWSWLLGVAVFPGAPVCDEAICSSPKRSQERCFCGRQNSSREKCA